MKHQRELEEMVHEMTKQAKSRDVNGRLLYQEMMQDPLVLGLFGAPEALFDVLKERPITVINLLKTNRALERFWHNFKDVWILLIETLIEREWPMEKAVEIYGFFVVENRRIQERVEEVFQRELPRKPDSAFLKSNRYLNSRLLLPSTVVGRDIDRRRQSYSIISYDPITRLVIDILQYSLALADFFPQPIDTNALLATYMSDIGLLKRKYTGWSLVFDDYVVCLEDGFLMKSEEAKESRVDIFLLSVFSSILSEKYTAYSHGPLISKNVEIVKTEENGSKTVKVFPLYVAETLSKILQSVDNLANTIRRHQQNIEPIIVMSSEPVPINIEMATKPFTNYRDLLYHPEKGLFNTEPKQQAFFISLLTKLNYMSSKEEVIQKYGQHMVTLEPLSCTLCHQMTFMVDPIVHKLAFCQMSCWQKYNNKSLLK